MRGSCLSKDQRSNRIPPRYGSSVPIDKVLDPFGGCLVAYEMNGVPTPPDHGKPARAMIPGHAGCRSCKWLHSITLSPDESTKPWQNKSYLGFAPDVRFEGDPDKTPGKALWKWARDPVLKKYLDYQQNVREALSEGGWKWVRDPVSKE
jgi:DMSO/TMAO reductase YedYZ molybdopterin-dependent catalytic subunit